MIEAAEQAILNKSLRAALESRAGAGVDAAVAAAGWPEALASDPQAAISILFGLQGEMNVSSSLDAVLALRLCPDNLGAAIIVPAAGTSAPPAFLQGSTVSVDGLGSPHLRQSEQAVCAIVSDAGFGLLEVQVDTLSIRSVEGLDPDLGLCAVSGTFGLGEAVVADRMAEWESALALGRLALAYELVGASRAMLKLATDHALDRVQFGKPIAKFQAVRHRLADSLVAIESAEATARVAWIDLGPLTAGIAKATAGRSAQVVASHCQQVLAGIGFTAEHQLHRYVRRVLVLDQLLGSSRSITKSLGAEALRTRTLPVTSALDLFG